jgi:hypothetical protein
MATKTETKEIKPLTYTEAYKIAGDKNSLLKSLVEFLQTNYKPDENFKYSKKSGWTIFYKKGGKPLTYVNLKENGFTVTVVIGQSLGNEVQSLSISATTKDKFKNAFQFHDGKWLNFDVATNKDIDDIEKLILLKKKPAKAKPAN